MPVTFTLNLVNNTGVILNRAALVGSQGSAAPANLAVNGAGVTTIIVPDGVAPVPGIGLLRYSDANNNLWTVSLAVPVAGGGAPNAAGAFAGAGGHATAVAAAGPPPPYVYNVIYT